MTSAWLSLGSNLGDPLLQLREALQRLGEDASMTRVEKVSPVYRTKAWGNTEQPDFLNLVTQISTALLPEQLLEQLLQTEREMGRVRTEKWGPRTIDIDILFYNGKIVEHAGLHLPHPRLHLRNFVLIPLHAIAPELVHPVSGKTVTQLLAECPDKSEVWPGGLLPSEL